MPENDQAQRRGRHVSKPMAVAAATGIAGITLGVTGTAQADANIVVTSLDDNGPGTLRQAVLDVDDGGTITFDPSLSGTIALEGQIEIPKGLSIQGPGASVITVSGAAVNASVPHRIFEIESSGSPMAVVTISGLTLADGDATGEASHANAGGAIFAGGVDLILDHDVITGGTAVFGPGIATEDAKLTVLDSVISGNGSFDGSTYRGGAIDAENTPLTVRGTTIDNNAAFGFGGGIAVHGKSGKDVTISQSTISNNSSEQGGGLLLGNADTVITNSTISGNSATSANESGNHSGGGIAAYYGTLELQSSTVAGNHSTESAAGISRLSPDGGYPDLTLNNTIVANNDVTGSLTPTRANGQVAPAAVDDNQIGPIDEGVTATYTLDSDQLLTGTGNITGSPGIGPLANNGGPTKTMRQAEGASVINTGDPDYTPPPDEDQRSFDRVSRGRIDIGAVELQGSTFSLSVPPTVHESAGSVTATITRTNPGDPADVTLTTSDGIARAGSDYTAISQTVHFDAGQATATVVIPILDDDILEPDEPFTVTLSNTPNVVPPATVTILDDEVSAGLARTGQPLGLEAGIGAALIAGGIAAMTASERRRRRV